MLYNKTTIKNDFLDYQDAPTQDQIEQAEDLLKAAWFEPNDFELEKAIESLALAINHDSNWIVQFYKFTAQTTPTNERDYDLIDQIRFLCEVAFDRED